MNGKLILFATFSILSNFAFGWSQKGHDVTAYIAEQHLTPATQQAIDSILDGKSLVYWSNWLDNASHRPEYKYTSTWHYKNFNPNNDYVNPKGDIYTALEQQIGYLKDGELNEEGSALALKMIIHLIGDLHQPMHMGRLEDRGGNGIRVIYFNHDNNLHAVWDGSIVETAHKWSYTEWQQQIDRAKPEKEAEIIEGTIADWGGQTYQISLKVYEATPQGTNISYDYVADWTPVVEEQFLRGGLRLAHVLNTIFDPEYQQ